MLAGKGYFYVQSQVYTDTFKNKPYTIPQREYVYTTPVHKPLENIKLSLAWSEAEEH